MPTPGKSVRIYLADGTATGIRHAELVNWTGQAIVCPRPRLSELTSWEETARPGVYILVGEGEASSAHVYIGEAESVRDRLKQQVAQKDFWQHVVLFTSKDDNLTKAHVRYLESRMYTLAVDAGRATLENSQQPTAPNLPRADRDAMEEFLGPVRILLGALGFNLLEPVSKKNAPAPAAADPAPVAVVFSLEIPKHGVRASGSPSDEGFIVFSGSTGTTTALPSCPNRVHLLREKFFTSPSVLADGSTFTVQNDLLFTSSSSAAIFLCGYTISGPGQWKAPDGRSLKEVEAAALADT